MEAIQGGVNREHQRSLWSKMGFISGHFLILLFCSWLIFFQGLAILGNIFGQEWELQNLVRAKILFGCVVLYWLRHVVTLFYLIARKLEWSEAFGLLTFFAIFEIGLILLGGGAFRDEVFRLSLLDGVGLLLLLVGSFLNSFSEIQRKWWKKDSINIGRCYVFGLFKYSMHINYFGDVVLFTGWCMLTAVWWSLSLPILMALMFLFFHIPGLDSYLASRYGKEFREYAKRTKKFIPWVL